jgi:hypothetical protein
MTPALGQSPKLRRSLPLGGVLQRGDPTDARRDPDDRGEHAVSIRRGVTLQLRSAVPTFKPKRLQPNRSTGLAGKLGRNDVGSVQEVQREVGQRQTPLACAQPVPTRASCLRDQHQEPVDQAEHEDQPFQAIRAQPSQMAQPEPRDPIPAFAVSMHFLIAGTQSCSMVRPLSRSASLHRCLIP